MKKSAGILMFRKNGKSIEVLLVHPGGPFWKNKDVGAWSIPKGEFSDNEDGLSAAIREFKEETGFGILGNFIELNPIKQKSGKWVYAWGVEGDLEVENIYSNTFKMEWPYGSGKWNEFQEVDKAAWFSVEEAKLKINPAQTALIDDLLNKL